MFGLRRTLLATVLTGFAPCATAAQPASDPPAPVPRADTIKADEAVIFFPTLARPLGDGQWEVAVHGWIFEAESGSRWRRSLLAELARALGIDESAADSATFRSRAAPFLADNERDKRLAVRIDGVSFTLPPSGAEGHFRGTGTVGAPGRTGALAVEACVPAGDERRFRGTAFLLPEEGLSVISDIDDTLKKSAIGDRGETLRRAFVLPFEPIRGMPELLASLREPGAAFHYVSASPWQLFTPLHEFLVASGCPAGSIHLKTFRWKDERFLDLFAAPDETKRSAIVPLLEAWPRRRFVLIGDASERDPEIYGRLAREYPSQIVAILILDPSNSPDGARYDTAFNGVPRERWNVFREPSTVDARAMAARAPKRADGRPRERGAGTKTKRALRGLPRKAQKSAMTYFPAVQYHRRRRLNCCVRDGNRCFPTPLVTDKPRRRLSPVAGMTGRMNVIGGTPRV